MLGHVLGLLGHLIVNGSPRGVFHPPELVNGGSDAKDPFRIIAQFLQRATSEVLDGIGGPVAQRFEQSSGNQDWNIMGAQPRKCEVSLELNSAGSCRGFKNLSRSELNGLSFGMPIISCREIGGCLGPPTWLSPIERLCVTALSRCVAGLLSD